MRHFGLHERAKYERDRTLIPDDVESEVYGHWHEVNCITSYAFVWQVIWRFGVGALFVLLIVFVLAAVSKLAWSHDSWINRGGYHNSAGEWCCGENDCNVTSAQHVTLPTVGYRLPSGEFVQEQEATPSPDGAYWVCRRPDKTIRCFFSPPESN